jgi:crotonobetainyl-CoA:carnitine CoA-transferase CaiB-like acyl-CoA transferase
MIARPLEGLRVLDLSGVVALPYTTALLADLGAEVIKVEGPSRLDTTRQGVFAGGYPDNRPTPDPWNRASTYNMLNRGKKSLCLDLSKPGGQEVLKDLIRVSDILMENFTPRVMRGWGVDYPGASALRPGLIMVSNSGYGRGGPYSSYPAQATTQEATHGLTYITGYAGDIPSKAGQSFVDFLAAWAAMTATLLALRYRKRFGKGVWIDIGMYQLGAFNISEYLMDWSVNGRLPKRIGNQNPWVAPQGCYPCSGRDQWCVLVARDDAEWAALCKAIDAPGLADDPRFSSNADRMAHHDEIDEILGAWTRGRDKWQATELLQKAGVPCGPVLDMGELNLDPHLRSRGFFETVRFPAEREMEPQQIMGRPWRFSRSATAIQGPAPRFAEHNEEIMRSLLGYSAERYAGLIADEVVVSEPKKLIKVVAPEMEERVRQGRLARFDADYREHLGIPSE